MVVNLVTSIISSTHKWVPAGVINGLFSSLRSMVIEFSIILSKVVVKSHKYQGYRRGWECTIIQCQWNTTFKRIKTPNSTFEMAVSAYTRWFWFMILVHFKAVCTWGVWHVTLSRVPQSAVSSSNLKLVWYCTSLILLY